jgi:hypothetical protein
VPRTQLLVHLAKVLTILSALVYLQKIVVQFGTLRLLEHCRFQYASRRVNLAVFKAFVGLVQGISGPDITGTGPFY